MTYIPLARPDISEVEKKLVAAVLESDTLSRGPMLQRFESMFSELAQSRYAIGISSGTAGLMMTLTALGVKAGDEVITVSFTVPATVNAIVAVGAIPVMVDIDESTRGMSAQALEQAITTNTTAVIAVHAFGQAVEIDTISSICDQRAIPLIEDACEAIGNEYKGQALGTWATIGVFGFYANKQITTGEGGMVVTNDEALAEHLMALRNHGRKMDGRWLDQDEFGWSCRLGELAAALGVGQLSRFAEIKQARREIASIYKEHLQSLPEIRLPQFSQWEVNSSWFVYVINLCNAGAEVRDAVWLAMCDEGIQCGRYFAPVHKQPFYQGGYHQNYQHNLSNYRLPVTEKLANSCLALPFFNQLTEDQIKIIVAKLSLCLDKESR